MIATVESTAAKLPPSVRDFQVYRFVKIECHSTRAAAHVFEMSQTRVRQIVARVVEYLVESAPQSDDEDATEERLYVAEQLAREQLEHLYQSALEEWHASKLPDVMGVPRLGKATYLSLAARITLCMAKVPVHAPPRVLDDEPEAPADDVRRQVSSGAAPADQKAPPVADCSVSEVSRPDNETVAIATVAPSDSAEATYRTLDAIQADARRRFLRPAQAQVPAASDSLQSGDADETDEPPATGLLSRHERRVRQRQRQRALSKR